MQPGSLRSNLICFNKQTNKYLNRDYFFYKSNVTRVIKVILDICQTNKQTSKDRLLLFFRSNRKFIVLITLFLSTSKTMYCTDVITFAI